MVITGGKCSPPEQQLLRSKGPRQHEAVCVLCSLLFQQWCGTQPQRMSPENLPLKPEAKDRPTHHESPAPPPSSDRSGFRHRAVFVP